LRSGATNSDLEYYILNSLQKKPEGIIKLIRNKTLKPTLNLMHTIGG
jgi:cyclic pyranopterin phosphate synthase